MTEFVFESNYFQFDGSTQQVLRTAIRIKFVPLYVCIFMDRSKKGFLETQTLKSLVWLCYIDGIFYMDAC